MQPKHLREDNKGNKSPASPPRLYPTPQYHLSSSHRPPHSSYGGSSQENASDGPSVCTQQGPEHLLVPPGICATGGSSSVANTRAGTAPAHSGKDDDYSSELETSVTGSVLS